MYIRTYINVYMRSINAEHEGTVRHVYIYIECVLPLLCLSGHLRFFLFFFSLVMCAFDLSFFPFTLSLSAPLAPPPPPPISLRYNKVERSRTLRSRQTKFSKSHYLVTFVYKKKSLLSNFVQ